MIYTVCQQVLATVTVELPDGLLEHEIVFQGQKAALAKIGVALSADPTIEWDPYDVTVEWDGDNPAPAAGTEGGR